MLKPIVYAEGLARGMGTGDLNGRGAAFCATLAPVLRKFPFTPSAQPEASLDEIGDMFKPKDGKLWVFYSTALKSVIQCGPSECTAIPSASVQVTPAFLHFFNQAAGFSRALYGEECRRSKFQIFPASREIGSGGTIRAYGQRRYVSPHRRRAEELHMAGQFEPQYQIESEAGRRDLARRAEPRRPLVRFPLLCRCR